MTYTISIGQWGSECVAGEIPDNIWKYIEDECDGDTNTYLEKLEDGTMPEEMKLAEDNGSFYDVPGFFDCYGPYSDGTLTVTDEDDNEIEIDASEFPKENSANPITHQRQKDNMKASWTDERRKAMSDRTKGIPKTEEHKRKIAESMRAWHNRNKTNH